MKSFRKKVPGYSLAEIMIVVGIIGVLMVFLVPQVGRLFTKLNDFKTKSTLNKWQLKIDEYFLDIQEYPKTLRDLAQRPEGRAGELWRRPFIEDSEELPPLDAQGNEIEYHRPPEIFRDKYKKYELVSYGEEAESDSPDKGNFLHVGR